MMTSLQRIKINAAHWDQSRRRNMTNKQFKPGGGRNPDDPIRPESMKPSSDNATHESSCEFIASRFITIVAFFSPHWEIDLLTFQHFNNQMHKTSNKSGPERTPRKSSAVVTPPLRRRWRRRRRHCSVRVLSLATHWRRRWRAFSAFPCWFSAGLLHDAGDAYDAFHHCALIIL